VAAVAVQTTLFTILAVAVAARGAIAPLLLVLLPVAAVLLNLLLH
jgi:hypothetical protein